MRHWKPTLLAVLVMGASFVPGSALVSKAAAEAPITIRIASLAPPGSTFAKILKAWGRTLQKETNGRVQLRLLPGSSKDDDREFIGKMRAGKLDAAGVSIAGLSKVDKAMLVLTSPGLITSYDQLRQVREKVGGQFEKMVEKKGFTLLQLGYGGKSRVFSTQQFAKPGDLKGSSAWAGKDNPVMAAYLRGIGAKPVVGGSSIVREKLQGGELTTVPASALAAVAFQWYPSLNYVSKDSVNVLVGGLLINNSKLKELSAGDRKILLDTAGRAGRAMDKTVMRDDKRSYQTLKKRGLTEVDFGSHRAEWAAAARKTREGLAGNVYSKALLRAVGAAAKSGKQKSGKPKSKKH